MLKSHYRIGNPPVRRKAFVTAALVMIAGGWGPVCYSGVNADTPQDTSGSPAGLLISAVPVQVTQQAASQSDSSQPPIVNSDVLESLKLLRSDLGWLKKDSQITAGAIQGRSSFHAISANVVGATVIVPIPPPAGYVAGGPVGPDLGLLRAAMIDMRSRLCKATQMATMVVIPSEAGDDARQKWTQTVTLINETVRHYNQLVQLCFEPQVNTFRLGQEALAMYEDTGRVEHLSKSVYASLRNTYSSKQNAMLAGKKRNIY
jgi:hypothetical protein